MHRARDTEFSLAIFFVAMICSVAVWTQGVFAQKVYSFQPSLLDCAISVTSFQCQPGGFLQQVAQALDDHGRPDVANRIIQRCSRNLDGESCLNVVKDSKELIQEAAINCIQIANPNDCSPMCRATLQTLQRVMGCCLTSMFDERFVLNYFIPTLNAVVLDFLEILPLFRSMIEGCDLDIESECGNSQAFTSVFNDTFNNYVIISNYPCTSIETQPVIDTIASTESCSSYNRLDIDFLIDLCGKTENNMFCVQHYLNGDIFAGSLNIDRVCRQLYLPDGSINTTLPCPSTCLSLLNNTLHTLGCCANIVNLFIESARSRVNTALWDHCGLPIQQSCPSTLTLPAVQSGSKVTRACKTLTIFVSTLSVIVTLIVLLY